MAKEKKNIKKSAGVFFRVIEFIIEAIGWLQIVASPLLIGLIIGAIIYLSNPTPTQLTIGIIVSLLGLIVGVIWATKQWKGKGTIWFMSRIMATPELDNLEKKNNSVTKPNDKNKGKR